jgi:hypothetical protein
MERSPAYSWSQEARHMGQLKRGESRWDVYLEAVTEPESGIVRGRIHFVAGERHRQSAWIFLEPSREDVRSRFNEFSDTELWSLMESLAP